VTSGRRSNAGARRVGARDTLGDQASSPYVGVVDQATDYALEVSDVGPVLVSGVNATSGSGTSFNGVLETGGEHGLVRHITTRVIETALDCVVVACGSSEDCVVSARARKSRADFATTWGSGGRVGVV